MVCRVRLIIIVVVQRLAAGLLTLRLRSCSMGWLLRHCVLFRLCVVSLFFLLWYISRWGKQQALELALLFYEITGIGVALKWVTWVILLWFFNTLKRYTCMDQDGLYSGRNSIEQVSILQQTLKFSCTLRKLLPVFLDLKSAFDSVECAVLWHCFTLEGFATEIHFTFLNCVNKQPKSNPCHWWFFTRVHHEKSCLTRFPPSILSIQLYNWDGYEDISLSPCENNSTDVCSGGMHKECCTSEWRLISGAGFSRSPGRQLSYFWDAFFSSMI